MNRCSHIIDRKPRRSKRISRTNRFSRTSKKSAAVRLLPLPFPPISPLPASPPSDVVITTSPRSTEKENDKKALAAIKEKIEADKRERAQKAAQEKALRDGTATAPAPAAAPPPALAARPAAAPAAAPATSSLAGRDFPETRLQIRLASGGAPLTTTLRSDASCVLLTSLRWACPSLIFFVVYFVSSARGGGVYCWSEFVDRC